MLFRIFSAWTLTVAVLVVANGCDTRPKVVVPTQLAPPPPKLASGGGAGPAIPAAEQREKLPYPKEAPDSKPLENKE
jgi:hypothetical protein